MRKADGTDAEIKEGGGLWSRNFFMESRSSLSKCGGLDSKAAQKKPGLLLKKKTNRSPRKAREND